MRVWLLRHGESEANVAGRVSDDPRRPWPLTSRGLDQARAAARELAGMDFACLYVSEHRRARQTAEAMRDSWRAMGLTRADCPIVTDPRLNERRSNLDGRPVEDFNGLVRPDPVRIRPPGGETFLEQMDRLRAFLDAAAGRHGGADILAVSHENPIQAARAVAGLDPEVAVRSPVANCTWVVLVWPASPDGGA